jgi:protein-tyrosine phosphatase
MGPEPVREADHAREFRVPRSPRPYFLLRSDGRVRLRLAERLLPLDGIPNFRDLGGYRTVEGRQVRWGRIYRSAQMDGARSEDVAYIEALRIGAICDLRSVQERQAQPNPLGRRSEGPSTRAVDYDYLALPSFTAPPLTRAQAISGFAECYAGYARFLAPQFTELFDALATNAHAVAFNCTLGKDRTGIAAALILSVLGVPRAAVVADYALTQAYAPPAPQPSKLAGNGAGPEVLEEEARRVAALPAEVYQVIFGSDPAVMRQALALIDERDGGPLALARSRMGLTKRKLAAVRERLLV